MFASLPPEHNYDVINDRYRWDESIGIIFSIIYKTEEDINI